jgi:voltage-gated potassium channel
MQDVPDGGQAERLELLQRIDRWVEGPMLVLAFVWLVLLVLELVRGLSPGLTTLTTAIWIVFILHFLVELALAPRRLAYLRSHWLTVLSLLVPALRMARLAPLLRLLRATRGVRLIKVVGSLNRGMAALGATLGRRGFGYVALATLGVTLVGAAGMFAFEREHAGMQSYGDALWWTAMIITTMGSEHWPRSPEGRLLCLLLSTYAFATFGYVTATLASHFVGRDAASAATTVAAEDTLRQLRDEVRQLRAQVAALGEGRSGPPR